MLGKMNMILAITFLATTLPGIAQKQEVPHQPDKLALGQEDVRQLLLLMDTDKNGKVSKQEWMNFMEAEFDRLDKDKSGELDVKEIAQSKLRVSHPATSVVGK
jgi:CRISPR/Cas system-associated endonuclease Cas3-HD